MNERDHVRLRAVQSVCEITRDCVLHASFALTELWDQTDLDPRLRDELAEVCRTLMRAGGSLVTVAERLEVLRGASPCAPDASVISENSGSAKPH